jgi:hypothetical protein
MTRIGVRRWITLLCGATAVLSFWLPFFHVRLDGTGPTFEISGRAILRSIFRPEGGCLLTRGNSVAGVGEMFRTIIENTVGARLSLWVAIILFLIAGPLLVAYLGIRYVIGAVRGGYGYLGAVGLILAYSLVGWIGLRAVGDAAGVPMGFFAMAGAGFWLGGVALAVGAFLQEVKA